MISQGITNPHLWHRGPAPRVSSVCCQGSREPRGPGSAPLRRQALYCCVAGRVQAEDGDHKPGVQSVTPGFPVSGSPG